MKKKGFTLVELLAVIVILAVIAVIAVPIIIGIIKDAKYKAAVESLKGYLDAAEKTITLNELEEEANFPEADNNGCYKLKDLDKKIEVKGNRPTNIPTNGTMCFKDGNVKDMSKVIIDGYEAEVVDYEIKVGGKVVTNDSSSSTTPEPPKVYKCKRATTLHTETCSQTSSSRYCSGTGYTESGSKGTTTITYGSLGTKGTLTSGDAFDCDVNGDGTYNSNNERFYYVSGLNGSDSSNIAVLIYYNNVSGGNPNNMDTYEYDESNENWHGPRTALAQLPTTSQWKNVSLSNTTRAITNENGGSTTTDGTNTHNLPTNFSYAGYAARLLTTQELEKACKITIGSSTIGELDSCKYLVENTVFSSSGLGTGHWLETPCQTPRASIPNRVWDVSGNYHGVTSDSANAKIYYGVRPAIEVNKSDIDY